MDWETFTCSALPETDLPPLQPPEAVQEEALETVQERVEMPGEERTEGVADKETVGEGLEVEVTLTEQLAAARRSPEESKADKLKRWAPMGRVAGLQI